MGSVVFSSNRSVSAQKLQSQSPPTPPKNTSSKWNIIKVAAVVTPLALAGLYFANRKTPPKSSAFFKAASSSKWQGIDPDGIGYRVKLSDDIWSPSTQSDYRVAFQHVIINAITHEASEEIGFFLTEEQASPSNQCKPKLPSYQFTSSEETDLYNVELCLRHQFWKMEELFEKTNEISNNARDQMIQRLELKPDAVQKSIDSIYQNPS